MTIQADNESLNGISFSTKELEEWSRAGLINTELLAQGKVPELLRFVSKNKEKLYKHYRDDHNNLEEFPHSVELPPAEKWPETYELRVIDRKTGKVVKTLKQIAELKLLDDIYLKVNARELAEWKKETDNIKNLTKEQSEDLKKFISQFGADRPLSREEIANVVKEIQKEKYKAPKYRKSGHLNDQQLKYQKPGTELIIERDETKKKIEKSKLDVKAEGIRLTEPESKLEHALIKLLRDNSQNRNPYEKNYYFGNEQHKAVDYGGEKKEMPVVRFKRSDLYQAYLCKNEYSGADAEYIDNLLIQYSSKKFLIRYDYVKQVSKGSATETRTDRIEEFQSLIRLLYFFPNLTDEQKAKLDEGDAKIRKEKEEVIVAFSPIFIHQIDTKFVEFPDDTNRRLMISAGGHRLVTIAMRRLMEYCLREISAKRSMAEINEENLIPLLGLEKYVAQKRKKVINESIMRAIDTVKNMGIILETKKTNNTKGGEKWIFTLNTKYE